MTRIIVLDDDPTGSQTVHGCLLLTRWDVSTLRQALRDESPLLFILTNTRGMGKKAAEEITSAVCRNLKEALSTENVILVSRSDSTLRGHYPVETDVIAEELGPFDAHFLVPAFFDGGRITRNSIHYLKAEGKLIPVHETEFARDSVFAYHHSHLPDYVEEKTEGRIRADDVERFLLDDLRGDLSGRLQQLKGNRCCVVDAESQEDLDRFAEQLKMAATGGKRFLFRSAASLLTSLARLPPQPVAPQDMSSYARGAPGAVIIGSHVRKTTSQLSMLLEMPGTVPVEVDVERLLDEREKMHDEIVQRCAESHALGKTPVVFTSRNEKIFPDAAARLAFGEAVSDFLMDVVRNLPEDLGYLISKGGITSNDVLSKGLELRTSRLLGQILPGCSVVRCPHDHPRYPGMPVVIFPGNVGDDHSLAEAFRRMSGA